jgi:predicted P-loop ATPase
MNTPTDTPVNDTAPPSTKTPKVKTPGKRETDLADVRAALQTMKLGRLPFGTIVFIDADGSQTKTDGDAFRKRVVLAVGRPVGDKTIQDALTLIGDLPEVEPVARRALRDAWRSRLIIREDDNGNEYTLAIPANVVTILSEHDDWKGKIAYDAFRETVVTLEPPPWSNLDAPVEAKAGEWTDTDTARAMAWLSRSEALHVPADTVERALAVIAERTIVHPVRDYLRGQKWDGVKRIDTMLHVYFGTDDTTYTRGVGRRWMISAVARVERPGCQCDCTLILEGAQGIGKTSGFRALVPEPTLYADTGINIGDKDSYQNLHGAWLYGLDELDSLKRGDLTRTKNFLSQTIDRYRPSYGRRVKAFARQTIFCGTTNEDEYLTDSTGNRRFWGVRVKCQVDVAAIRRDRDQLWAEALVLYRTGTPWHADTVEFRGLCEAEQSERVQRDPWETIVAAWLECPTRSEREVDDYTGKLRTHKEPFPIPNGVLTVEVLVHALGVRVDAVKRADEMRAAAILRGLGWKPGKRRREGTATVRRYQLSADEAGAGHGGG